MVACLHIMHMQKAGGVMEVEIGFNQNILHSVEMVIGVKGRHSSKV